MKKNGFTLLEVLIATVLLTVGVVALVGAFSTGMFVSTINIENMDLALNIARANMETIKNQNFADIDTDVEISGLVSNLGFSDFTVSGDVAQGDDPMQVDVSVGWDVKGEEVSITLTTLVADVL